MAMEASEISRLIKEALPDAVVTIEDLRGDGDHGVGGFQIHAANVRTRDHDGLQGLRLFLVVLRRGCVLREGSSRDTHGSDGTQRKSRLHGL